MLPPSDQPAALAPDDVFLRLQTALAGEYSIERELGRGGMGIVYLAREVRLARQVAIKVLPPSPASSRQREQFVREAQTAARLSHPNIVPIHRVDEAGGFVYFVMAYVDGETLAQRIQRRGPLAPHQAGRVLREVAWALTYAHSSGIVHRDIKADNILLERGGDRAIVTDFGIAGTVNSDARSPDGDIVGSAHYASPEQIAGQPLDALSDIYSLGVVGYLALTGRLPFDAPTLGEVLAMHLNAIPASICAIAPGTPAKLAQVVERCLAKRAEHRFASAADFAAALDAAAEPPRELPAALRLWVRRTNELERWQVLAGIGALGAVGLPVGVVAHSALLATASTLTAVVSVAVGPSFLRTRRVLGAGYALSDLRAAMREYWTRKREEVAYELSDSNRGVTLRGLWGLFGGGALLTSALTAFVGLASPGRLGVGVGTALVVSWSFTLGSGLLALSDWSQRTQLQRLGVAKTRFYESKWGERFVKLCGWRLKRQITSSSLPQLTEVALGRATDALFDALPKTVRKQLGNLPDVVRRLESDATLLRSEIDKLDASLADLDRDARPGAPSAIVAERELLRSDLRDARERAAGKLAATVAALENIRLGLLRLQLGDGRVESVTATLDAAQRIGADITAYADAQREVEQHLARRPTPIAE